MPRKTGRPAANRSTRGSADSRLRNKIRALTVRLQEAEDTLAAIQRGEVDGLVVTQKGRDHVFTLEGADHVYRIILETMQEGAATFSSDGTLLYCNGRFAQILGRPLEKLMGAPLEEIMETGACRDLLGFFSNADRKVLHREMRLQAKDGGHVPIYAAIHPILVDDREVFCLVATDISPLKSAERQLQASLREKEMLLKEIHHRVKNNLQVMSSLFRLQAHHITENNAKSIFVDCQTRIQSMALVHQKLYQSREMSNIDFNDYLKSLIDCAYRSYNVNPLRVTLTPDIPPIRLGIDTALPLGLIINELLSNALKHAFPSDRRGEIRVALSLNGQDGHTLVVSDNGVGLPGDFSLNRTSSFGLEMVKILAQQICGRMEVSRGNGSSFHIIFSGAIEGGQGASAPKTSELAAAGSL